MCTVGGIALVAVGLAVWRGWGAEAFVTLPSSLGLTVYVVGCLAGVRLLRGWARAGALVSAVACPFIVPFAGGRCGRSWASRRRRDLLWRAGEVEGEGLAVAVKAEPAVVVGGPCPAD